MFRVCFPLLIVLKNTGMKCLIKIVNFLVTLTWFAFMSKYVSKNNLAFTTARVRGVLEVGVVADKCGNTLFEVVHCLPSNEGRFCVYFEKMSSVLDYIATNFKK